jgi:hypothetical protein
MKPTAKEALALALVAGGALLLKALSLRPVPVDAPPPAFDELFGRVPEFRVEIAPEDLAALNAALPSKEHWCSRAVRNTSVPAASISLDGRKIPGEFSVRYRGYCDWHWRYKQKSLKLTAKGGRPFAGYQAVNLNAMNSDPFLYEIWATELLRRSGGIASRAGIAKLWINGRYDGIRELVENLDADLLRRQGLPKGAIYRERESAGLGGPLDSRRPLKDAWKKNALKKADWSDIEALDAAVKAAVVEGGSPHLEYIDLEKYVNYNAVITIAGTTNLSDHNVPMFRPKDSKRFHPVGYDFTENGQALHSDLADELQSPYTAMNWLSQLLWADPGIRKKIHRRIAVLLERFPDLVGDYDRMLAVYQEDIRDDIAEGRAFTGGRDPIASPGEYDAKNKARARLGRRIPFLRRAYLDPVARARPDWKRERRSQIAIEGSGVYSVRLRANGKCSKDVRLRAHLGAWRIALRCENGRPVAVPVEVERNDILRPEPNEKNYWKRTSVGPILLDVDNPEALPLAEAEIRSLQTGREVPLRPNWPFLIEPVPGPAAAIAARPGTDFRFIRTPRRSKFRYEPGTGRVEFEERIPDVLRDGEFGPILCWNIEGRGFCHEFHDGYDPRPPRPEARPKAPAGARTLDAGVVRTCEDMTLAGDWFVPTALDVPAKCALHFEPGARLLFGEKAWLHVTGPAYFPEAGPPVRFEPVGRFWGGIILAPQQASCRVENAEFRKTSEFRRRGKRYTAALSLRPGKGECVVENVRFEDAWGDDALRIDGGSLRVSSSAFVRVRDGIDFNDSKGEVLNSLFVSPSDDGIDLDASGPVLLRDISISGAGDKGISASADSVVRVERTRVENGNRGVFAGPRATVTFADVDLRNNAAPLTAHPEGRFRGSVRIDGAATDAAKTSN